MTLHERAAEPAEIHVIWAGATAPQKDPAYRLGHRDPGPRPASNVAVHWKELVSWPARSRTVGGGLRHT